ncbi:hypothetical protein [Luteibacter sp.]|uniref:hypothetical protein n=1 Tax=Luteibacter sp. TaxID=1886636 RepID=UPI003F7E5160
MKQRCLLHLSALLSLLGLGAFPAISQAEGVPGGYAGVWRSLCPLIANAHGFVDSVAWRSMFHLPSEKAPIAIDHWTSMEAFSSADGLSWGTRLTTSRYEAGKTSAWIEDPRVTMVTGYRSELSVTGPDPEGQLSLESVEKTMSKLGFRRIGSIDPYGRSGEYIFVRTADTNERLNIRFEKGPETIAYVAGISLTGYQRDNHWTLPRIEGACKL